MTISRKRPEIYVHEAIDVDQMILLSVEELKALNEDFSEQSLEELDKITGLVKKNADLLRKIRKDTQNNLEAPVFQAS